MKPLLATMSYCLSTLPARTAFLAVLLLNWAVLIGMSGCSKNTDGEAEGGKQTDSAVEQLAGIDGGEWVTVEGKDSDEIDRDNRSDHNKGGSQPSTKTDGASDSTIYSTIEWIDLLPEADLKALENPPEYLTDIEDGSESDQLENNLKAPQDGVVDDPYQQALVSKNIRPEYNGRHIRIPGFIVPLEFDEHETITSFFFVPYFGACIHMPPPPPNQIIYAQYEPGIRLEALYDPFWISGILSTTMIENDLASAAYTMSVAKIEPYME